MNTTTHDLHSPVDYDHELHRYSHKGERYTSATQLLDQFIPPFDVEERAQWMSYRYGNTAQYWKDKWKSGNSLSLTRGNLLHDDQERALYSQKFVNYNPLPLPVLKYGGSTPLINLPDGVYPELMVWRHAHRLAGRMDKAIFRTVTRRSDTWLDYEEALFRDQPYGFETFGKTYRVADIEDYKTSKKIARYGYQDHKTGQTRKLLAPLQHIEDAEFWHYTLQLSIYQFMLESHGFLPGSRTLIHFPHPTDEFPDPAPVRHELPYLRDEVLLMLKHRKQAA